MKRKQNIIAIVYDFDGTLTPASMQDYTVLKKLGITKASKFWADVTKESRRNREEKDLTWMRKIKKLAEDKEEALEKQIFEIQARKIIYFKGVKNSFQRINRHVKKHSKGRMIVRHYIISSGLKEILDGISIRDEFHNVFGSEYHYKYKRGRIPDFPKVVITDTVKTQYIFRINKGKEKIWQSINTYMPEEKRPIPFRNIIYIGDGMSDVPAMNVTKKNGGYAIAVYKPYSNKGKSTCRTLLKANRVDFIAPADYRNKSELKKIIELILDTIIQRYLLESRRPPKKAKHRRKRKRKTTKLKRRQ